MLDWTFQTKLDRKCMNKKCIGDLDWVTRNPQGLKWEDGKLPFSVAYMINYFENKHQLYAKGCDKCLCLQQHTASTVIDIEQLGCPPANELPLGASASSTTLWREHVPWTKL